MRPIKTRAAAAHIPKGLFEVLIVFTVESQFLRQVYDMDAVLLLKRQGVICVGEEYIPRSPLQERDVILDVNGCTMFDDFVLVLQERTSDYEDRPRQDKTLLVKSAAPGRALLSLASVSLVGSNRVVLLSKGEPWLCVRTHFPQCLKRL